MWANSNFITSQEQIESLRRTEIPEDLFEGGYDAEAEGEALRKRFFRGPENPWGKLGEPESGEVDLNKSFGYVSIRQEFDSREPFDLDLSKILREKLEPVIEDALRKSIGDHGHFHIQKSSNGTECAISCDGKTIACRTNGVSFTDAEINELRNRCSCTDCQHNS